MSQNLYKDAIAEARQLREMAEQNAKNKIIDAVSPRIKQLIERQLLESENEELAPEEELADSPEGAAAILDLDGLDPSQPPAGHDAEKPSAAANISIDPEGEISLNVGNVEIEIDASGSDAEDLVLGAEIAEALATIVGTKGSSPRRLSRRLKILEARVKKLSGVMNLSLIHI